MSPTSPTSKRSCRRSRTSTPSSTSRRRRGSRRPGTRFCTTTSSARTTSSRRRAGRGSHASCSRPRITPSACTSWTAPRRLYEVDDERRYDHTAELRPDSLYGVSKAYGEALGRMYMERHGLRVSCLRIGAVREHDDLTSPTANPLIDLDAEGRRNRLRAVWLSQRDCAEPLASCLDVDDVSWAVVYGVSGEWAPVLGSRHTPGSCSAGSRWIPHPS